MSKFQVSGGLIFFLYSYNTELERSSKIMFPVSERHRWVVIRVSK